MATYNTFRELAGHLGIDPDSPTPESQKLVYDWMQQNPDYEAGSVTNKYMEGYEPPQYVPAAEEPVVDPQTEQVAEQPADQLQPGAPTPDAMAGDPRYQAQPQSEPQPQPTRPAAVGKAVDKVGSALSRWTPVAAQMLAAGNPFTGKDPTGEAAGARALAAQNQKAAAEQSKIMQWNKQRATDNTLADKMAAAQASGKWRQNANALGAEGGASVVASQNEAVTPDIMAQKQYQSQSMGAAGQALTEADKHKRQAIANETNANRTDYYSGYNEALNNQATNLAIANQAQSGQAEEREQTPKKEEKKPEPVTATPEENKSEPEEQQPEQPTNEQGHQAETNKQADSVDTASEIASDNQQLEDIIHRVEGINTARRSGVITPTQESNYNALKEEFDQLANKMGGAPRSLPPLYVVAEKKEDTRFNSPEYENQPAVVDPGLSQINPEILYQRYGQ